MDVEVSGLKSQTENLRKSLQNSNVATSWGVFRVRIKKIIIKKEPYNDSLLWVFQTNEIINATCWCMKKK